MTTTNIILENTDWTDVETAASISFTDGDVYTITFKGGTDGEVCTAASTPDNTLIGHPLTRGQSFTYTHKSGDKLFIKASIVGTTVVLT
jgi:hypothetical protein